LICLQTHTPEYLQALAAKTLAYSVINIAGTRESKAVGIQVATMQYLLKVLAKRNEQ
jgi:hypothetical protein